MDIEVQKSSLNCSKKGRQEIDGVWKKVRGMLKMALKIVANRFGNKKSK